MAAHARLKTEFTEDEKYHNLMSWLKYFLNIVQQETAQKNTLQSSKNEDLRLYFTNDASPNTHSEYPCDSTDIAEQFETITESSECIGEFLEPGKGKLRLSAFHSKVYGNTLKTQHLIEDRLIPVIDNQMDNSD